MRRKNNGLLTFNPYFTFKIRLRKGGNHFSEKYTKDGMNFCASILVYEKPGTALPRQRPEEKQFQSLCENGKKFLPIPLSYVQNTDILVFTIGMAPGTAGIARSEVLRG